MNDRDGALSEAEQALGVTFRDRDLLEMALTHPSFSFEVGSTAMYQRLEFLGDSVLGFIITEYLYRTFVDYQEGRLAKLRSALVNGKMLASVAERLGLGDMLFIGRGAELTGARHSVSILADVMEAIIGAVYLDHGIVYTRRFVLGQFEPELTADILSGAYADFKSELQEHTIAACGVVPHYVIVGEEGPSHAKRFRAEVRVAGEVWGSGEGPSKKAAEQVAAHIAWTTHVRAADAVESGS